MANFLYRVLLRAFPASFRERFGADMRDVFSDRWRTAKQRGVLAMVTLLAVTTIDTLGHGVAERRAERRARETTAMWQSIRSDVRFGLRRLQRRPGFAVIALITLGLGIGAATSVFSVANAVVLRAMPYTDADRVMRLQERQDEQGFRGNVSLGNLDDWCGVDSFEACGAFTFADVNLATGATPERVRSGLTTLGALAALGSRPIAGRLFTPDEAARAVPVAIVSQTALPRLFPSGEALGQTIVLNGVTHDVIGVLPEIPGTGDVAVWRPLSTSKQSRMNHAYRGVAKLKAGVGAVVAQAQLDAVSKQLQQLYPDTNAHWWAALEPLQSSLSQDATQVLRVLGALVGVLVLLCATNVAGLVAGQSSERRHELAVRLAVGADRRRLFTQLVVESGVLAIGGAMVGVLLASWATSAVVAVLPRNILLWRAPGIDWRVLAFAVITAASAALIFGVLPASGVIRRAMASAEVRSGPTIASGRRARSLLTALQTALATVLLVAAGLLGTVLLRLITIDPGFDPRGVMTFRITPPPAGYADVASLGRFYDAVHERLTRLPQVDRVAAAMAVPMGGPNTVRGVVRLGEPLPPPRRVRLTLFQVTTPGYFQTLGITLRGRDFDATDRDTAPPVAIINQKLASMLWPAGNAIGQQILVHTDEQTPRLVIGVAADILQSDLDGGVDPMYYVPFTQSPRRTMAMLMKTRAPIDRAAIQAEISAIDGALPLYELSPLESVISDSTSDRKALTGITSFFGAAAVLLAALGLYGLVSALVAERQREIGIRVALGAESRSILRLMLRRGVVLTTIGLIAGLGLSMPVRSLLATQLTTEPPSMAGTMAIVAIVLAAVSLVATVIPARRALGVDPVKVLKA